MICQLKDHGINFTRSKEMYIGHYLMYIPVEVFWSRCGIFVERSIKHLFFIRLRTNVCQAVLHVLVLDIKVEQWKGQKICVLYWGSYRKKRSKSDHFEGSYEVLKTQFV